MTVTSTNQKVSFNGDGSTTVFAYNYKIFAQTDLLVILRVTATGTETKQFISTNYTVSGVGTASGGNVTMGTAPASGTTLTILRVQPNLQGLDLVPNDPFPAGNLEASLDKLTFMVQTHEEEIRRSIKASKANTISTTEFSISASDRANKVFSFDSLGDLNVTQELGTFRGSWAASTAYVQRDLVKDTTTNNIFIAKLAHTSSGSEPITTNTDAAKWALLLSPEDVVGNLVVPGDLSVGDDVKLTSDAAVLGFGVNNDVTLTHVHDTGLLLNGTRSLQFNDASQFIHAPSATVLDINATDEIELNATLIDVNGNLDVSGTITLGSGAVISEAELEMLDGITAGTVAASKAVVVDANKDASSFRNLTASGAVTAGSLVIGSADIAEAELEMLDGITAGTALASKAMVLDSAKDISGGRNLTISGELDAATLDISGAIDVAGNITVTGTVDGRDVAADGVLATNALPKAGGALTGNVTFGDNNKAIFGEELEIFTDGTHSFIKESGSGDLLIYGNNLRLGNADGSELYILGNNNADVQLRYNNSTKLATTSTGVAITGGFTATAPSTITSNTPILSFIESDQSNKKYQIGSFGSSFAINDASASAFRLVISTSGKVGIGTTSPNHELDVKAASGSGISITPATGNATNFLDWYDTGGGPFGRIGYNHQLSAMTFSTVNNERMRIDSSGNVLVGTTSATPHTGQTVGVAIRADGGVFFTRAGADVLNVNRTNSDGDIALFRKNGSTVGQIGTLGGTTYIGSTNGGIMFNGTDIEPTSGAATRADNTVSLGSTNFRVKDAYLSGGVFLGGTGAANKLDDYEEGTWTPSLGGNASYDIQSGLYRKVGAIVFINGAIRSNNFGTGSTKVITGLPFPVEDGGSFTAAYFDGAAVNVMELSAIVNGSQIELRTRTSASNAAQSAVFFQTNARLFFNCVYGTTA